MMLFLGILAGVLVLLLTFGMLYCLVGGADIIPYRHMSYDEEIEWLMKDYKLTKEEAEEIAKLPWK